MNQRRVRENGLGFKGVQVVRKNGRKYYYYRYPRTALPDFATHYDEFVEAYQRCVARRPLAKKSIGAAVKAPKGSINEMIAIYMQGSDYAGLSDNTKRAYGHQLAFLRDTFGERSARVVLAKDIVDGIIDAYRAAGHKPNERVVVIRKVARIAMQHGLISIDPTTDFVKEKPRKTRGRDWTVDEIQAWRATHKVGTAARLAFEIAYNFGMRRSDVIRLGPWHRDIDGPKTGGGVKVGDDGRLWCLDFFQFKMQQRREYPTEAPIGPALAECLAALPADHFAGCAVDLHGNPTRPYLREPSGRDYTADHFTWHWRQWATAAGLPADFNCHGGRNTVASNTMSAGVSKNDAMRITGHESEGVFDRYAAGFERRVASRRAFDKLQEYRAASGT